MTSPTLISRETIRNRVFTVHRALFVTPRGGCGVRYIYRIDGKTFARTVWEQEARTASEAA